MRRPPFPRVTSAALCVTLSLFFVSPAAAAEPALSNEQVVQALQQAIRFYRNDVGSQGGYVWRYSDDLILREGEKSVGAATAWVQPPGLPTAGKAFLAAWEATGEEEYLQAATETAERLVQGQLVSGGWDYRIDFDADDRGKTRYRYRVDNASDETGFNVTTLDDNTTQAALNFLMRVDQALEFKHQTIHEAAGYALHALLEAQYLNGAWPQRFSDPPHPDDFPVKPASYPDEWSRIWPHEDYREYYTFNDNTIADTIDLFFNAYDIYNDPQYRAAALRGGDFILLAQMPEPQPAWAQQYDRDMHPAWARKFEPPAVTGNESQGVLNTLLNIYARTGEEKYLEPVPRALAYLRSSLRDDGRLARFYELNTNKPLYFTKQYELTYSDDDMPTHYGFIGSSRLDSIERRYQKLLQAPDESSGKTKSPSKETVLKIIDALDDRGAWVGKSQLHYQKDKKARQTIDARTFSRNIDTLSEYLKLQTDQ